MAALVIAGVALVWFFPARWALALIGPRLRGLQVSGVSGLVWDGRAEVVRLADGRMLGAASWHVSRRVLWADAPLRLQLEGPRLRLDASVRGHGDTVVWDATHLRVDLAMWRPRQLAPLGLPHGEWDMDVDHAVLRSGWPQQLRAQALWRGAVMVTRHGELALGDVAFQFSARDGVLDVHVADTGTGALQVAGDARLTPLGWQFDMRLRSRGDDPALRRWLATLGPRGPDGAIRWHRAGGLAALAAPTATASTAARTHSGVK